MKVKKQLQLATLIMGMILLTSCSSRHSTSKPAPSLTMAGLSGYWGIDCLVSKDVPGYFYDESLKFKGDTLETILNFHKENTPGSDNCLSSSDAFSALIDTKFVLGEKKDGHRNIDFTTTKVMLKPMDKEHVGLFNRADFKAGIYSGLGLDNWTLDDWKDVTNVKQAQQPFNIGSAVPDIFEVSRAAAHEDLKLLKMGDKHGHLDKDKRPTALDEDDVALYLGKYAKKQHDPHYQQNKHAKSSRSLSR